MDRPVRLKTFNGIEVYKLSRAEQVILSVLDGTALHDLECDNNDLDYISELRAHTCYSIEFGEFVGRHNYPEWLITLRTAQ